jgi:ureidoglycolate lyase
MKLARFSSNGQAGIGIVVDDTIVPLPATVAGVGDDMIALITRWTEIAAAIGDLSGHERLDLDSVSLLAPIARPGKIWGIGLNYADHAAEAHLDVPEHQLWFTKAQTCVAAPYQPIERPKVSAALDYEAELVFVIGKAGRNISEENAQSHIFGYCAGNDVSVRDFQFHSGQFSIGKSFDTHAPFGPWITTCDEISAENLPIRCLVNGEVRQASNTQNLIYSPAKQIAYLSQAMTLEPGDIIFTGTPGGVGAAMKPPQFLRAGDRVRVEIEGLGHLENIVVEQGHA